MQQREDWVVEATRKALSGDEATGDLLRWRSGWMPRLYRVQHEVDGRGPFRPGFSGAWLDAEGDALRSDKPPVHELWGMGIADRLNPGEVGATGVHRLELLASWFSTGEVVCLAARGYVIAEHRHGVRIIEATTQQAFFGKTGTLAEATTRLAWRRFLSR